MVLGGGLIEDIMAPTIEAQVEKHNLEVWEWNPITSIGISVLAVGSLLIFMFI